MKTLPPPNLRAGLGKGRAELLAADASVRLGDLAGGHGLAADPASLDGAHVLVRTQSQLGAALALIALDGIAARLVIAPPDLKDEYLPEIIARAGIDTQVHDGAPVAGLKPVEIATHLTPFSA